MTARGQVMCGEHLHTLEYDEDLVLLDHDLDRELAFEVLRGSTPTGCLGVHSAWCAILPVAAEDPDFMAAMRSADGDLTPKDRLQERLIQHAAPDSHVAYALRAALGARAERVQQTAHHKAVLLGLPRPLMLAFCSAVDQR